MADLGLGLSPAPQQEDFSGVLAAVGKQYPALARHLGNTVVSRGNPMPDGRQLEFYPPWESENPTPGKIHIQLYDKKLSGDAMQGPVAADMLHYLGSLHPDTTEPVDPAYFKLKQSIAASMTGQQDRINQEAYKMDQRDYGADIGSYKDWLARSRVDAYIRAGVFPEQNPEWKNFLTQDQQQIMNQIKAYLTGAH